MPYFVPPIVYDNPTAYPHNKLRRQPQPVDRSTNRMFGYYSPRARGRTVLKIDGTYATYDTPTTAMTAAATEVYLGGHTYEITDEVAAELQAQGYTIYDTAEEAGFVHGERVIS